MSEHQVVSDISFLIDGTANGQDIVLLHGWGCDYRFFEKQRLYFASRYRVLVPDLPGFGRSAAIWNPTVPELAKALSKSLAELGASKSAIIGHSLGGTVALELYKLSPNLVHRLIMIDNVLWPSNELKTAIDSVNELLRRGEFDKALAAAETALFLPSDSAEARALFHETYRAADRGTLVSSFSAHLIDYKPPTETDTENRPMAYIGADNPFAPLDQIASRLPGIKIGKTIGSGHFCPFIVPDQVNAMIDGFLLSTLRKS